MRESSDVSGSMAAANDGDKQTTLAICPNVTMFDGLQRGKSWHYCLFDSLHLYLEAL
jgi:hypothetical protein